MSPVVDHLQLNTGTRVVALGVAKYLIGDLALSGEKLIAVLTVKANNILPNLQVVQYHTDYLYQKVLM